MSKLIDLTFKHPDAVVLVLQGGFYHAIGCSAEVLSSVMKYKLRQTQAGEVECGFPYNTLERVMNCLEREKLNYVVYQSDVITNQYSDGEIMLNEYLKDANIPPPIPIIRSVHFQAGTHGYKPGMLKIKCSNTLVKILKERAAESGEVFDKYVAKIIKKGLEE